MRAEYKRLIEMVKKGVADKEIMSEQVYGVKKEGRHHPQKREGGSSFRALRIAYPNNERCGGTIIGKIPVSKGCSYLL